MSLFLDEYTRLAQLRGFNRKRAGLHTMLLAKYCCLYVNSRFKICFRLLAFRRIRFAYIWPLLCHWATSGQWL